MDQKLCRWLRSYAFVLRMTILYTFMPVISDPSQPQAAWSLQEGWVAQEAKALLPPKSSGRSNLIQCYQALMLTALMDVKLFEVSSFLCIRVRVWLGLS